MPIVAMPDGTNVAFPDDMPSETIRGMIAQKFPQEVERAARERLATGLARGERGDEATYRTASFRTNLGVPKAGPTDAAINGATMGWGDEFSAAARAPIDMALRGESFEEAYRHNVAAERDRLAQYYKESPITAHAAEIAGSFVGGSGLRRGGGLLGGRLVPEITTSAAPVRNAALQGAISGAGEGEGLGETVTGAATGGALGGALGTVISGIARTQRMPSIAPTADELKDRAKYLYESGAVKGLEVKPNVVADAVTGIRAKLDEAGFDDVIASKAHAILKRLESVPEDAVITGQNLRSVQRTLGNARKAIDPSEKAGATMALRAFNDFLENMPTEAATRGSPQYFSRIVQEANANYSAAKTAEEVDRRVAKATLQAESQNSGMNVASKIRQQMQQLATNPKASLGMRPEEKALAERIAKGDRTENALRLAGNWAGGGGGLGTLVATGIGAGVGGLPGLALPVGGLLLRKLSERMTLANADRLSEMIRSRAPLASATQKFEERVAQFVQARDARSAAAAALAARNLSNNLKDAGINLSAADLMRVTQR